ncbi:HNH endonuclease [Bacillus thuringiensis]|uniref:HNH endonuclease n=1 Tax=Bacillus thuringiensis TaxID=1428 RepID=UPI000B4302E5|nr:HNH endonuclease [Bacillus thuringiensis]MED3180211.1 HNH endonuclease [Bacillus thuringiensis]OTY12637.1 hypothetical protein BK734_10720 [Bacillus thuringiensis serovar kim]OUB21238.1 hypothetical protein BK733_04440 [Bacillus thuringiensis serovar xiaguangiensis]
MYLYFPAFLYRFFQEEILRLEEAFVNNNYDVLICDTRYISHKSYLSKENNFSRTCRFCGKSQPEVSFNKEAHVIPHMLGNQYLLSKYECDECNQYFSILENQLGNYTLFIRSILQQKGKKGYPKFKRNAFKVETVLMEGKERIKISDAVESNKIEEQDTSNHITISGERDSYIPIAVYKCLIKIAITLMPEEKVKYFSKSIKWILEKDHLKGNPEEKLYLFESIISPHYYSSPKVVLYLRKRNAMNNVPYAMCTLYFGYFMYQFYIPMCEKDTAGNATFRFIKGIEGMNKTVTTTDLSDAELKKGEKFPLEFIYEKKEVYSEEEIKDLQKLFV